jgi:hypothetical protein
VDVRADEWPLLDHAVVQRSGRARGARQGNRSELKLRRRRRLRRAAATVAVEPYVQGAVGRKGDGVFRPVVRRENGIFTALKLHQPPANAASPNPGLLSIDETSR